MMSKSVLPWCMQSEDREICAGYIYLAVSRGELMQVLRAAQDALLNGGDLQYEPAGYGGRHIGALINDTLRRAETGDAA